MPRERAGAPMDYLFPDILQSIPQSPSMELLRTRSHRREVSLAEAAPRGTTDTFETL
jgi:hypothetical protein